MVTYYAKHFTYIISHKREAKSYFILHPQSPQAEKKNQSDSTWPWGPCAHEVLLSRNTQRIRAGDMGQIRSPAGLVQEKIARLGHFPPCHTLHSDPSNCSGPRGSVELPRFKSQLPCVPSGKSFYVSVPVFSHL